MKKRGDTTMPCHKLKRGKGKINGSEKLRGRMKTVEKGYGQEKDYE